MSKKISFGKFIAAGSLGIIAALVVAHFTWVAPQVDRKEKMSALVNSAHAVQLAAIQHYALMPSVNTSTIELQRAFPKTGPLNRLVGLAENTGVEFDSEFSRDTLGNALGLSNYVLTGNSEPKILPISRLQNITNLRRVTLMESVPLWPWS